MKTHLKIGLALTSVLVLSLVVISVQRPGRSPAPGNPPAQGEDRLQDPDRSRKSSLSRVVSDDTARWGQHSLSPEQKMDRMNRPGSGSESLSALIQTLADPELSKVDRNRIEHRLGASPDKGLDKKVRMMLEDGVIDLSDEEGLGKERLMSAIRIAGLRSDTASVNPIIDICNHPQADEEVRLAGYEALGYLGTNGSKAYLRKELSAGHNGYVRSQIVLSLATAEDGACSEQFLADLRSDDPDLRDSAIIALGKIREERAVEAFQKIYDTTSPSSQILIVQALKDMGSPK